MERCWKEEERVSQGIGKEGLKEIIDGLVGLKWKTREQGLPASRKKPMEKEERERESERESDNARGSSTVSPVRLPLSLILDLFMIK